MNKDFENEVDMAFEDGFFMALDLVDKVTDEMLGASDEDINCRYIIEDIISEVYIRYNEKCAKEEK